MAPSRPTKAAGDGREDGYVQAQLGIVTASRVGVLDTTLRSREQGTSRPTARDARALARELGVKAEDLGFDDEVEGRETPS